MPPSAWLFCGSDRGGERAAVMYSLIVTAKMNDIDPQAWLADVLGRIAEHPAQKLDELLPWNWHAFSPFTLIISPSSFKCIRQIPVYFSAALAARVNSPRY